MINRFLNNISLAKKILILFIGGVLIPLAIQYFSYYKETEKNIQNAMITKLNSAMDDKAEILNGNFSRINVVTKSYSKNMHLYRLLDKEYSSAFDFLNMYQDEMKAIFEENLTYDFQIRKITVYTDNRTMLNSSRVEHMDNYRKENYSGDIVDIHEQWIGPKEDNFKLVIAQRDQRRSTAEDRSLSIVREMNEYPDYSRKEKLLKVDANLNYLSSCLRDNNLFENMFVTDSENRIVMSANTYRITGAFDRYDPSKNKNGIIVLKKELRGIPLTLYGLYDSKMISKQFAVNQKRTLSITLFNLMLASVCILLVSTNITSRTRLLVNQSKEIAKGNFVQIKRRDIGEDEIGVLQDSMNRMSEQLMILIDNEYSSKIIQAKLEKENAQAKLLALQSQVNPHFMFNALESIRLKALAKQEAETARMLKYMSRMFRHLINWDEDIIYLEDDIKFLDEFLCIQKYRFEDDFSYEIEVEDSTKRCLLPKLIIQPLVENACVHGVEAITNERKVHFSSKLEEQWLVLKVVDNGGGMSTSRLKELKDMIQGGQKIQNSVGLHNVYQRLVLYYEEEFTFDIDSKQGEGTSCTIKIPIRYI